MLAKCHKKAVILQRHPVHYGDKISNLLKLNLL